MFLKFENNKLMKLGRNINLASNTLYFYVHQKYDGQN